MVIIIDEIELAWVDNGNSMWNVTYTRAKDNTQWVLRLWAKDELAAYKLATETLERAS